MSKPLTREQRSVLDCCECGCVETDAVKVALLRLDYLEEIAKSADLLEKSIEADSLYYYNDSQSTRDFHLNGECGNSGHCGYCSEAREPYTTTSFALKAHKKLKESNE